MAVPAVCGGTVRDDCLQGALAGSGENRGKVLDPLEQGHQAVLPAVFVQAGAEDYSATAAKHAHAAPGSGHVQSGAADGSRSGATAYVTFVCK